jgi:hypothetical protein
MSIYKINRIFLLATACTIAPAATLYDSGTGFQTPPQSGLQMSGGRVAANSFSLSNIGTIQSVTFYTLECCGLVWSGTINYYLFTANGFSPSSSPFAQGSVSLYQRTEVYSDSATNAIVAFDFDLTAPITLAANTTYWLGLGLTAGGSGPGWNSVIGASGLSAVSLSGGFNDWSLNGSTGAFSLSDTNVQYAPEPGSVWMLMGGAGFMALRYLRYRGK